MDNLTHTAMGFVLAAAGLGRSAGRAALPLLVVASNLPDADTVLFARGTDAYVFWHRGLTHSALGIAVTSTLAALLLARLFRAPFATLLGLFALGQVGHVLMDLPTSWGTMVLYPFSERRFAADWVFIVDLVYLGILVVPLLLARAGAVRRPVAAAAAIAALAAYVLFCARQHAVAHDLAARSLAGAPVERARTFPQPLSPFRWHAVVQTGGEVRTAFLSTLDGAPPAWSARPFGLEGDAARVVAGYEPARRYFTWWAGAPFARVVAAEGGGREVVLGDLRFRNRFRGDLLPFQMVVRLAPDGSVLGHDWRTLEIPPGTPPAAAAAGASPEEARDAAGP